MGRVFGKGTPRGLQGHRVELLLALLGVWREAWVLESGLEGSQGETGTISRPQEPSARASLANTKSATSTTGCYGSMAQRTVVPRAFTFPIPKEVNDETAAALPNPGVSAWLSLAFRAKLVVLSISIAIFDFTSEVIDATLFV